MQVVTAPRSALTVTIRNPPSDPAFLGHRGGAVDPRGDAPGLAKQLTTWPARPSNTVPGYCRARRQAVGDREVGRTDVHGVDARHGEDVLEAVDGLDGLDHGDAGDLPVGVGVVVGPCGRVAVGPKLREPSGGAHGAPRLGLGHAVHHRDDQPRAGVEHPPDDPLLVPRHPHDGRGVGRRIAANMAMATW